MDTVEKIFIFSFLLQGVCYGEYAIYLPKKIEALSGSCVIIECRFEIDEANNVQLTERDATGFWFKKSGSMENEVFNSRDPNNFKGKMSEKVHEKNCTTIFYNVGLKDKGTYVFRIESGFKYTYSINTSEINVIESPLKPQVKQLYEEQKGLQDKLEVLEGRSVSLRCSAETLCSSPSATLKWSSKHRILLSENSKLQKLIISDLNFTAAPHHHNVPFTCSISYQLQDINKTAHNNITLHVQYSPKNISVSVFSSHSLLEGSSVTLTCSSEANPAVLNYSWSRESKGRMETLHTGDTFTINKTEFSHRGLYFCTAQNKLGNQTKSVLLDIQYAPQIYKSSNCNSTDITVCFCEVDGNPFPEVQWLLSGRPVSNSSDTFIREEQLSNTSLRSFISLHQSFKHTKTLMCFINNAHGNATLQFHLVFVTQNACWNLVFVVTGVAAVALVITVLYAVTAVKYTRVRTNNGNLLKTTQEGGARRSSQNADQAVDQENEGDGVYVAMSCAGAATENQLINRHKCITFSSSDFSNSNSRSLGVEGVSSLHADYATVRRSMTESSRATEAQVFVSVDVVTKQRQWNQRNSY